MTEPLIKRLQTWAYECEEQHGPGMWSQDMRLAAEAIERLHATWYTQKAEIEYLEAKISQLEEK